MKKRACDYAVIFAVVYDESRAQRDGMERKIRDNLNSVEKATKTDHPQRCRRDGSKKII